MTYVTVLPQAKPAITIETCTDPCAAIAVQTQQLRPSMQFLRPICYNYMSPQLKIVIVCYRCLCAVSTDILLEWVTLDVPMYATGGCGRSMR